MNYQQATTFIQLLKIRMLYRRAFPRSERKPFSMITSMRKKGKTDIWYFERDGAFAGLATTVNGDDLILLDYLAVPESKRGTGAGSEILQIMRRHYSGKGLFLEIESVWDGADNHEKRARRKHFYLANGMTEMNTEACVFGVDMELLGFDGCRLDFEGYRSFYRENISRFSADNITPPRHP